MDTLATVREEVDRIRDKIRLLRQRTLSPSYRRRARKLKSSRRLTKKVVRDAEGRVAARLASLRSRLGESVDREPYYCLLAELRHLLTWRLKIDASSRPIWIDDVLDVSLSWRSGRVVSIAGTAWVGPANDVSRGCKRFLLTGFASLDAKGRRLTTYTLVLSRKSKRYVAKRQSN